MKRAFIIIISVLTVVLFGISCKKTVCDKGTSKEYAQMTVVVEIDKVNDKVICKDFNGMLWAFHGCEDWAIGDIAAMIMNDNSTEIIYDDIIVSVKYDGWIDGWF